MVQADFEEIQQELISTLNFPQTDVLKSSREKQERKSDLMRVFKNSDSDKSTVKIYFEDEVSRKVVESTVWAVTDKRVILRQSTGIPISRIHSVKQ